MNSASPFPTFFSDPLLPPLSGGPSEEFIDFFPTASSSSSSFAIDPNGLVSHQKPSWEDQKWTDQPNWSYSFAPTFFDPTYDFNPPQPPYSALDLSSGCTSPSSSRSSSSFDASLITPISSSFPLFPSQTLDLYDNYHSPTPKSPQIHTPTSTVISTSSRGRKRVAPASFAEDEEDPSPPSTRKLRSKGKNVKERERKRMKDRTSMAQRRVGEVKLVEVEGGGKERRVPSTKRRGGRLPIELPPKPSELDERTSSTTSRRRFRNETPKSETSSSSSLDSETRRRRSSRRSRLDRRVSVLLPPSPPFLRSSPPRSPFGPMSPPFLLLLM